MMDYQAIWDGLSEAQHFMATLPDGIGDVINEHLAEAPEFWEWYDRAMMHVNEVLKHAAETREKAASSDAAAAQVETDVNHIPTAQIAWFFLSPGQRDTLKSIGLDTKLNLRHQYFKPHIDVLTAQGFIKADGDGYIVTKAGLNVYDSGWTATAEDELAFWRSRQAEIDAANARIAALEAALRDIEAEATFEIKQAGVMAVTKLQRIKAIAHAARIARQALGDGDSSGKEDSR